MITESRKTVKNLIKSSNSVIYNFSIYGSRFIKQVASTSPDGFIQLMLQLVWHRLHDSPTAVYESVSTRKFSHSRTETCRSLTNESWRFVKSFDDDDILVYFNNLV